MRLDTGFRRGILPLAVIMLAAGLALTMQRQASAEDAPAPASTPLPTLSAPVDVTGSWHIDFTGAFSGSCASVIEQDGTELHGVAECDIIGSTTTTGTIDPTTGAFHTDSGLVKLDGVVAADGNTITGTWNALDTYFGEFVSTRVDDLALIDLSGLWEVALTGDGTAFCGLQIDQALAQATATLDCPDAGPVSLTGDVNPFGGWFSFWAEFGTTWVHLSGEAVDGDAYLRGYYSTVVAPDEGDEAEEVFGSFIAVPEGALANGIIALGCGAPGEDVLGDCYTYDEPLDLYVLVVAPPEGGYDELIVELSWSADVLGLDTGPASTSAVTCEAVNFSPGATPIVLQCVASEGPSAAAGPVATLAFSCLDDDAQTAISVKTGSFSRDGEALEEPLLIGTEATCSGPGVVLPEAIGDVDCDGRTTSIDALFVLQYEAAMISDLPCMAAADASEDGSTNAVDAALILQIDAGLLAFPVP